MANLQCKHNFKMFGWNPVVTSKLKLSPKTKNFFTEGLKGQHTVMYARKNIDLAGLSLGACTVPHTYLRSQNLILLSKWPLMIVFPIPLPATMSLQLEPANRVLVPGMGMERLNRLNQITRLLSSSV